jgi:hypothetical protein
LFCFARCTFPHISDVDIQVASLCRHIKVERNMSSRVLNRYKKIRLNKTSASLHTFRLSQSGPLYAHLLAAHSTNAPHLYIFNRLFLVSLSPERRIYRSIFSRSSSRLFNTPHFLLNVTWSFPFLAAGCLKRYKVEWVHVYGIIKTFGSHSIEQQMLLVSSPFFQRLKKKSWLIKILFHSVVIHRKWQKFWARPAV